ncbi:MAG: endolytic transglycosylase MltG [Leptospiraceae bacterium]|nr:endolytic transglycosylase MltG [Leptospiraceae bacterium]MCP5496960.1 endolytic transglycosylase MltG [Leptospiraceae bacterium]
MSTIDFSFKSFKAYFCIVAAVCCIQCSLFQTPESKKDPQYTNKEFQNNPNPKVIREINFKVLLGERVKDWCKRLESQKILKCEAVQTIAGLESFSKFSFIGPKKYSLSRFEGLFPVGDFTIYLDKSPQKQLVFLSQTDTYKLLYSLLEKKEQRLQAIISQKKNNDGTLKLSLRQKIILASIVEKEAVSNQDYELVASVFYNRLKKGIRLASCPTLEYALGYHRPFLLYSDLKLKSPYNVYKNFGLPPTPISFFSEDSFGATSEPKMSQYYFFVYDWTKKELFFAKDYDVHKQNAIKARNNYVKKYGKNSLYQIQAGKFYEH